MKTSVVAFATAVAVVSAAPNGGIDPNTKINCAKPNANYCMAGDIILRCDANSVGTRGRCSDNVAGYPPAGGVATCWQSSEQAGDAACQKNCVVYAEKPFTLPASQCTPSATVTGTPTATPTVTPSNTPTGIASIPEGTSLGTPSPAPSHTTSMMSIPEGTSLGTATVPQMTSSHSKLTNPIRTSTGTWSPTESDECPAPTDTPTTTGKPGNTTSSQTTGPNTSQTAGANANHAVGALAAAGFLAAFFF